MKGRTYKIAGLTTSELNLIRDKTHEQRFTNNY